MGEEWLQKLKKGDEVILEWGHLDLRIETVDHATPTLVIVCGDRYQRSKGYRQVDDWRTRRLYEATEEAKAKILDKQRRRWLVDYIERVTSGNRLWGLKTGDLDELATVLSRMTGTTRP